MALNCPGMAPPCTHSACGGVAAPRCRAASGTPPRTPFENSGNARMGFESVVQGARSEWVMMLKKMTTVRVREEIGGQGSERWPSPRPSPARERERLRPRGGRAGAPGWRGTVWANGSGGERQRATLVETPGSTRSTGSGSDFVSQGVGGELVMARSCPEFQRGKAEGSRLCVKVRNSDDPIVLAGGVGDNTVVGHRGNLTPDLDLDLNHDLVLSVLARTKENPSKSGWSFVRQNTGDEWVMREDCPEIGGSEHGSPAERTRDAGRNVSFVPNGTSVLTFRPTHRWKRWAIIGRPCGTSAAGKFSGVPETARIPESGGFRSGRYWRGNVKTSSLSGVFQPGWSRMRNSGVWQKWFRMRDYALFGHFQGYGARTNWDPQFRRVPGGGFGGSQVT